MFPRRKEEMDSGGTGPVRCMHIIHSLGYGGAERIVYYYAKFHDRDSFAPEVVTFFPGGEMAGEIEGLGVKVHSVGSRSSDPRSLFRLGRIFRDRSPAVAHFHNPLPVFAGFPAAAAAGVPARILTEHSVTYSGRTGSRAGGFLYSLLRGRMDAVIACSEEVGRAQGEAVDPGRMHVVLNGVDTGFFVPGGRERGGGDELTVGSVGSLTPQKGFESLLDAAAILAGRGVKVRFSVVGEGPLRPALENRIRESGLEGIVELPGSRRDIRAFLAGLDLLAGSSLYEGLPLYVLEAMSMGLPVVTTDAGGNREAVVDGVTGLLVPPRDPEALAEAIERLAGDASLRSSMGRAARERAVETFSARRMVRETEEIYMSVLEGKSR